MKKTEKSKVILRTICIILAVLMVVGLAYTGIYALIESANHVH